MRTDDQERPSIDELAKFLEDAWFDNPDSNCQDYGHVDVFVGWVDDHTDKVNGGYNAESYHIGTCDSPVGTGRPGMKNFIDNGYIVTKLTINGKDLTDRIDEFINFVTVNDREFKV